MAPLPTRIKLLLALALFCGCNRPTNWRTEEMPGCQSCYKSRQIIYSDNSGPEKTALSFLVTPEQCYGYLTVGSYHIGSNNVRMVIDDKEYLEKAILHEGAQKLALASSTLKILLQALQEGKTIKLSFDEYELTVDGSTCPKAFFYGYIHQ